MSVRRPRAAVVLAAVWLAGVLLATSVSLLAVRLVAAQVGDPAVPPLTALATPEPQRPTPAGGPAGAADPSVPPAVPTATAPAGPAAPTRAFTTPAGSIGVQCSGTALRLLYATPASGYGLDERSATGSEGEVRFESGAARVRVRVSCASGRPVLVEQRTDSGSDGDRDNDDVDEVDEVDD